MRILKKILIREEYTVHLPSSVPQITNGLVQEPRIARHRVQCYGVWMACDLTTHDSTFAAVILRVKDIIINHSSLSPAFDGAILSKRS